MKADEAMATADSPYWSALVRRLTPYVPGEQPKAERLIKLNTNENPWPPSRRALEALTGAGGALLRLYPDPEAQTLRAAIARHFAAYGITPAEVFVGNGSDEVLAHAFCALLQHELPILFPDVTYSFYPVYCRLYGIACRVVPTDASLAIREADYLTENGGIIFPNPNAPTGQLLPLAAIERIAAHNRQAVVVVDEAYIDFAGREIPTAVSLVKRHPNLLVVQTLSKSRSLAGLRVGFAIGDPALIEGLRRVKDSFNSYPLDRLALAAASAAIDDTAHFDATRLAVIASRDRLTAGLAALGFTTLPSAANFVFTSHPARAASELAAELRARHVIVRHFRQPRIDNHLRITVGSDDDCQALLAALKEII